MIHQFAIRPSGGGTGGATASLLISAGTFSDLRTDVTFNNSNGVSFGLDAAGVITATVQTNYLTTAMASNRGSDFVQATAGFHGTNASGTIASSGISVSVAAPGAANINISAGTTSNNLTAVTFSNSNNVTFGLNASTITASVTVASTQGSINFSAGTTSQNLSNVFFSNVGAPNFVSFGIGTGASSSVITASHAVEFAGNGGAPIMMANYLEFDNSNGVSFSLDTVASVLKASIATTYAGTGFTTATTAGTNIVGTLNTSGLSMGVPAFLTTAMQSNAATISNINISAGTTSNNLSAVTFSNSNNVSFGLNGSTITGSIATTYAGTGFTSTTTAGTAIVGTLNTSGLSLGVPAFLTTAALSSQTLAFTLGGNSGTTNSSQILNGGYILAGGNNITINQSNNSISIVGAAAGTGGGIVGISNSQTLFTSGTVAFSEGGGAITIASSAGGQSLMFSVPQTSSLVGTNGISISTNGSTISVSNIGPKLSAGTLSSNRSDVTFSNSNGVSFGLDTNGVITASIASTYAGTGFTTATTAGTAIVGTLNTSGLSMGVPAFLTTAAQSSAPNSYWANLNAFQGTTTTAAQSNSFYVLPLSLSNNLSISYLRLPASFNFTSTTIATTAVNNATGASTAFSETLAFNAVLYTVGTGGSSRSLQYFFSTSAGLTWAASVSQASTSNATNQSFTQRITFPNEGFTTDNTSTQYSVSATNGPISTTQWSNLTANRYLDIPFATSLTAGNYWLALNRISGTVGGKNLDCNASTYGVSNINLTFANMNSATNLSNGVPFIGLGLWTTNAAQTTSSIGFGSISNTTSYALPFVLFIRQA